MKSSFEPYLKKWSTYEKLMERLDPSDNENSLHKEAERVLKIINIIIIPLEQDEVNVLYEFFHNKQKVDDICLKFGYSRSQYYRIRNKAYERMESFVSLIEFETKAEQK